MSFKRSAPKFFFFFFILLLHVFLLNFAEAFAIRDSVDGAQVTNDFGGDIGGIDQVSNTGVGFPTPDQTDRNISAFFGEMFMDGNQIVDDQRVINRREDIDEVYSGEDLRHTVDESVRLELEGRHQNASAEAAAKKKAEEQANLERRRRIARERYERHENVAEKDGWTEEETEESNKRWAEWMALEQFTPEEQAEQARFMAMHLGVVDEINRIAYSLGGTSPEERQERRDRFKMSNSGTKTWRKATFTGNMVDQVAEDTFSQREMGIAANNKYQAALIYLKQPGITQEQREVAEQIRDRNYTQMGYSADAISTNAALVLAGTASDVVTLGAGKPASMLGNKVSTAITGTRAATTTTTTAAVAGSEAAAQSGARAGAAEAGNTTQILNKAEQQLVNQAYNDAQAAAAVARGGSEGAVTMEANIGNTVLLQGEKTLAGSGAASGATAGSSSGTAAAGQALTEAEAALFRQGVSLSESQLAQKMAIMKSGRGPTQSVDPKTYGALHQSMMKNFPDWRLQFMNRFLSGGESSAGAAAQSGAGSSGSALGQAIEEGATVVGK